METVYVPRFDDVLRNIIEHEIQSKAVRDGPRPLHVPVSGWVRVAVSGDWAWEKPQVREART